MEPKDFLHGTKIDSDTICCPRCGKKQDGALFPAKPEIKPKDGYLCLCFYCLALSRYTENVTKLVKVTEDELYALEAVSPGILIQIAEQRAGIVRFKKIEGISEIYNA